jgi:hypothetical protein
MCNSFHIDLGVKQRYVLFTAPFNIVSYEMEKDSIKTEIIINIVEENLCLYRRCGDNDQK